jgi:hypothetical protein
VHAYETNFLVPDGGFLVALLVLALVLMLLVAVVVGGTLWFAIGRRQTRADHLT